VRRSIVIDTDTASDDAVAILLAVAEPDVEVRAITVVAGNVPLDLAVRNALVTLDITGAPSIEVFAGRGAPLTRPLDTAQFVHGDDGMGGAHLPTTARTAMPEGGVDALVRIAREEPGRHDLLTLGPLTNVAAALAIEPGLLTGFGHTYLMAGSPDGVGNVNALGEYNVWADPEAATAVFAAPGAKTMIGWNISRHFAVITPGDQDTLAACGPVGEFVVEINRDVDAYARATGLAGFDLPDSIAMAIALDDTLILDATDEHLVVGADGPTRGCTLPDRRIVIDPVPTAPPIRVVWAADEDRFKQRLFAACRHLPGRDHPKR
jgi:purine nucleosidase